MIWSTTDSPESEKAARRWPGPGIVGCRSCRFWQEHFSDSTHGKCWRFPSAFDAMETSYACGEWRRLRGVLGRLWARISGRP